jgi:DNA-binding IclR family transcriptional regulator
LGEPGGSPDELRTPLLTLDRGLQVLALLSQAREGLTVRELADALGVHRAVVYRLLTTLELRGLVRRDGDGRHRLGTGVLELARGVARDLQAAALPVLADLAEELDATAALTVADGDEAVALLVVEPTRAPMHVAYRPGRRHPLRLGASGKAILAGRPAAAGEPAEIALARKRGYASSAGEIQPGAVGIAAPVVVDGRADASVGAVSLAPFDGSAAKAVRAAARAVAAALD